MQILDKEKLLNTGYLSFNLKDVDVQLYDKLYSVIDKTKLENSINTLRYDCHFKCDDLISKENIDKFIDDIKQLKNARINHNYDSDSNLISTRLNVQNNLNYLIELEKKIDKIEYLQKISQKWYTSSDTLSIDTHIQRIIFEIYQKTIFKLYESEIGNKNYERNKSELTLYLKNNFIESHNDGIVSGRVCVSLIYLNDDYIDGYGGEIKVSNEIIKPTFGQVVILDFTKHNVEHEVLPVLTDNFKRFAFIKFFNE